VEKLTIKPSTKEILIRSSAPDGHSDLFSYNYWGDSENNLVASKESTEELGKKLGGLFIVGQVKPETEETSYMVSLVASLAKREYYSKPELGPREAFAATLKKINEVLEDFFKNKNATINIGLFVIAGENMLISKLGKFKIILARNNENIDVLNNINLFSKEHIQEKEFSNIISGKILPRDKILAFYPSKSLTSRESYLKTNFLKCGAGEFTEKLTLIKAEKENFECAAIHVTIERYKEQAVFKRPQPPEMRKKEEHLQEAKLAAITITPGPEQTEPEKAAEKTPAREVPLPQKSESTEPETESSMPSIIPSEVSLGTKESFLSSIFDKFNFHKSKNLGYIRSMSKPNIKTKYIAIGVIVIIIAAGFFGFRKLFIVSPEARQLKEYTVQAQNNLTLAKNKIAQQDLFGARQIIINSVLGYVSSGSQKVTDQYQQLRTQFINLLDGLDKAIQATKSLVDTLPKEVAGRNALLAAERQKIGSGKYKLPSSVIDLDLYEGNLYILAADSIYKVADTANTASTPNKWLSQGNSIPLDPLLIAVDGKAYVLNKSGLLTIYYKGEKLKELNTYLFPDSGNSLLLTTKNSDNLYLVDKKLGRIYILTKEGGLLIKTLKIDSTEPIIDAYIDNNQAIYLLTKDNRIWKII